MKLVARVLVVAMMLVVPAASAAALTPSPISAQAVDEPAVVVPPETEGTEEQAWTFRFLVPTLLVAAIILVALSVRGYRRLKTRYRVVE